MNKILWNIEIQTIERKKNQIKKLEWLINEISSCSLWKGKVSDGKWIHNNEIIQLNSSK